MKTKTHHIYLTFPSDVKMNREKTEFSTSVVVGEEWTERLGPIIATNESALKYILYKKWEEDPKFIFDKVFLLATKLVRQPVQAPRDYDEATSGPLDPLNKKLQESYPLLGEYPTHIDVLCAQLNSFYNEFNHTNQQIFSDDDIVNIVECDDLDDTNQLKKSIIELCHRIVVYTKQVEPGAEIKLYIDTSGGLRNAAMIFLIVSRIMTYLGITVESVYYTSYKPGNPGTVIVHDSKEIYNYIDLIAGFDEFKLFGSAKKLKTYFDLTQNDANNKGTRQSESLQSLWSAVDEFADIINISRRGSFEKALTLLTDSLNTIKSEETPGDLDASFISFLQQPIEDSYAPLIESFNVKDNEINPVRAVEWCLAHDYLQQALTLFIEYIPDYLIKQGFINVDYDVFTEYSKKKKLEKDINIISKAFKLFVAKHKETETFSLKNLTEEQFVQTYLDEKMKDTLDDVRDDTNLVFNELNTARSRITARYINKKEDVYKTLHPLLVKYIKDIRSTIHQFQKGNLKVDLKQAISDIKEAYVNEFKECIETEGYVFVADKSTSLYQLVDYIAMLAEETGVLVFQRFSELPQELKQIIYKADQDSKIFKWTGEDTYEIKNSDEMDINITGFLANFRKLFYDLMRDKLYESQAELYKPLIGGINLTVYDFEREIQDIEASNLNPLYGVEGVTISRQDSNDIQKIIKILAYYSEIKKSRNDSNHARIEASSQFTTSKDIRYAMTICITLIDELQK